MGPRRERLPNRRAQATETVTWRGQEWSMSVGFDQVGRARTFDNPASAFRFYVLRRKAIDEDINHFCRELCGTLGEIDDTLQLSGMLQAGPQCGNEREHKTHGDKARTPLSSCLATEWILRTATKARFLVIGSKHVTANGTWFQFDHVSILSLGNNRIDYNTEWTTADVVCSLRPRRIAW